MQTIKIYLNRDRTTVQIINVQRGCPNIGQLVAHIMQCHYPYGETPNYGYEVS
jgi:hypothetical protein